MTKALERCSDNNKQKSHKHRGKESKRSKRPQDTENSEESIKTLKNDKELKKKKGRHVSNQKDHIIIENIVKDKNNRSHHSKKEIVTGDHHSKINKGKKKYVVCESKRQKSIKKRNDYKDKRLELSEKNYSDSQKFPEKIKDDSQKKRQKFKEETIEAERNRQKVNEKSINFIAESFKPKDEKQRNKDNKYFSNLNNNNFDNQLKLKLANDSNSVQLNDLSSNDLKNIGSKVKLGSYSQKQEFLFLANEDTKFKPDLLGTKSSYSIIASDEFDEYNYDDDDFEDYYESDFEEDIGDEESLEKLCLSLPKSLSLNNNVPTIKQQKMQDLITAINQENERVASSNSLKNSLSRQHNEDHLSSQSSLIVKTPLKFTFSTAINFSGSKDKSQGSSMKSIVLKRSNDLLPHIQLDVHSFDLFEMKPVTEYNFYMQTFGTTNTRQIATQSNDDAVAIEVQTDVIELVEKWQQHPQDGQFAFGGEYVNKTKRKEVNEYLKIKSMFENDKGNFNEFIRHSSCLFEISSTELNVLGKSKSGSKSHFKMSESYINFNESSFTTNRKLCFCLQCEDQIIQAFTPITSSDNDQQVFINCGIIYIKSLVKHQQREQFLICDGIPKAGYYSAMKHVLFVGTAEGIVLVYDLNEPSEMHCIKDDLVYRFPSYTSAWMKNCHTSPIVSLDSVASFEKSNQIFSLDKSSLVIVWVFVENVPKSDDDKGLSPLAVVKLVKNISTETNYFQAYESQATCGICPDSNTFYIGNNMGEVVCRNRDKTLKNYKLRYSISRVVSISCNAYLPSLILVGYQNGSISLFMTKSSTPLVNWKLESCDLKYCHWSSINPSLFFVLDNEENIYVFDLLDQNLSPLIKDHSNKKVSQICLNKEIIKKAKLLVSYTDGSFDLHEISSELRSFKEENMLDTFISSILI